MHDIEKFVHGFTCFQQQYFSEPQNVPDSLRAGQRPATLVIGCCDARVDPMLLTGSLPGELFVVRNIANLVPPCTPQAPPGVSSAIEFAICNLEVARVIQAARVVCRYRGGCVDGLFCAAAAILAACVSAGAAA